MKIKFATLVVLVGFFTCSTFLANSALFENSANADEKSGRLSDGRAFRVDAAGNQLVDYIAELEVNVEGLNRQVESLRQEMTEKESLLTRCSSAKKVEEKALPAITNSPTKVIVDPKMLQELNDLREKVEILQTDLQVEKQLSSEAQSRSNNQINKLQDALQEERASVAQLRVKVQEEKAAANTSAEATSVRCIVSAPNPAVTPPNSAAEVRASLSMSRLRAIESVRGRLSSELNALRGLMQKRDKSLAARSIPFTPSSALRSNTRGMTIDQINRALKEVEGFSDLASLQRDVMELSAQVRSARG